MSDLIDRQKAIDALKENRAFYCDNTPGTFSKLSYAEKSRVDELDTAIATLINLPPSQPEQFGTINHAGSEHPLSDEEIIPRLRQIQEQVGGSYAIDRAIELLTAQHVQCDDAVSRKAVQYLLAHFVDEDKYVDACDGLKHLPPVMPKQRTEALKAEIKRMKRSLTICINSDYYTGYMSALSALEGYIAQLEGVSE